MEDKVKNFFNTELLYRISSVAIFVPLSIFPLIFSNYLSVIIYLIFNSIILIEIKNMIASARNKLLINLFSVFTIISFFSFLFLLISKDKTDFYIIEVIITIWLFDTLSFIGGKLIGGKKLMPKISSGKTISGFLSGIIFTIILIEILKYNYTNMFNYSVFITFIIIIFSFIGDTLSSIVKRYTSVKDSGTIMPGHGGLLDRFDSFIAVFFMCGVLKLAA